jgi:hypothetical protein
MSESVSYNLYLSSFAKAPYLVDNTNLASVKYNINWDTFFNRDNYRYKSCRLRYKFLSDPSTSINGYTYDPTDFNGVIVANGLPPMSNPIYGGTIVGTIEVAGINYNVATVATTNTVLVGSDLNAAVGQSIQVPTGFREVTIQLWQNTFASTSPVLLNTITNMGLGNWNLILNFELYDPIDEQA